MKDLILISAHCSTLEKRNCLNKLIDSFQSIRKDYDLMVVSHLPISNDISEKVNYAFYDSDNTKVTEWHYLNSPWLWIGDDNIITSVFFCTHGAKSNYLAIYRLFIIGFSFAKSFGYKKVHYIEYDCYMDNFNELYDNTKLLDEYDAVMYHRMKEEEINYNNKIIPVGHFHSVKMDNMHDLFLNYNENKLKDVLLTCAFKTNEYATEKVYSMANFKICYKSHSLLETTHSYFNKSADHSLLENKIPWIAPYYDEEADCVFVIFYNIVKDSECTNLTVIVNDTDIHHVDKLNYLSWTLRKLGKIEDINKIAIFIEDKLNKTILLNENNRNGFKLVSYRSKRGLFAHI